MDVEVLIACVYKRSPIWDKRHKLHANRNVIDKLWTEIAAEMKCEGSTLRKKWKYLRDNFSAEYSKRPVSRSGDGADNYPQSKWTYFRSLLFLKDIVAPRACSGSIESTPLPVPATPGGTCDEQPQLYIDNAEEGQSVLDLESILVEGSVAAESQESTEQFPAVERVIEETDGRQVQFTGGAGTFPKTPSTSRAMKRKSRQDDHYQQRMCDIEERKLQYLFDKQARKRDNEDADTDLMFLKTLLPHIRLIPQHMKLRFQSKVQAVIEEFAYSNNQNFSQIHVQTESLYQSYSTSHSPSLSHSPSPTTSFDSAQQLRHW
ncbi:uncharacterized protein LOC106013889 [Aplysia californica]|uniref:Uncharacterized protein LOC106013889 n=1 Tax=Aplysia californica TaxID=6500 RepID=A0ABM1AEJ1_APLCA|nr:uncharacterized protein LOC106013889 [Aplysia californica]